MKRNFKTNTKFKKTQNKKKTMLGNSAVRQNFTLESSWILLTLLTVHKDVYTHDLTEGVLYR